MTEHNICTLKFKNHSNLTYKKITVHSVYTCRLCLVQLFKPDSRPRSENPNQTGLGRAADSATHQILVV